MPHHRGYRLVDESSDDEQASRFVPAEKAGSSNHAVQIVVGVLVALLVGIGCLFIGRYVVDHTSLLSPAQPSAQPGKAVQNPACLRRRKRSGIGTSLEKRERAFGHDDLVRARAATVWFKPTIQDTFLYDIENARIAVPTIKSDSGVTVNASVYIVDMAATSATQIKRYKASGKKVVCYFSAGSWEPWRADALDFDPACYCGPGQGFDTKTGRCKTSLNQLDGWDEWWLDIHSPTCLDKIKAIQLKRIQAAQAKGCDGLDPDNVDAFDNEQSHDITESDAASYVRWLAQTGHSLGMASGLKNAAALASSVVNEVDFAVTESCVQYDECASYSAFGKAKNPQWDVEYGKKLRACPTSGAGTPARMMQYTKDALNARWINLSCQK